jgi:hypothetical protein
VLEYLPLSGATTQQTKEQSSKDPAIVLHALGQGHVVTVTTTVNAEWTSFPAKRAFLPLMHELLAGSVGAGDHWMNLNAGQSLQIPRNLKLSSAPALAIAYRSAPLMRPGIYRLSTGASSLPIAVNVPADEADVRTIDNPALKKSLNDIDVDLEGDALPATMADANLAGHDFGWPFMVAVLVFVAAECFMAMRFGHYRR